MPSRAQLRSIRQILLQRPVTTKLYKNRAWCELIRLL